MALLVPGAEHRLLAGKSRTPLDPRWITVHTMVGTVAGTESFFSPSGRPYSHFGAGGNGRIRQWQDLRFRAASDKDGNPFSISIECEDHGAGFPTWSGSDVPRFTPAQASSLVVLLSWLCHRFGLPKRAIGSSCPHERGIGWHRLGIDPWRQANCLKWSKSRGKACPGDRRIAQLRAEIIPRVSSPPEVDDVTPQDHAQIKNAVHAAVRGEVQRLGQYLAAGETNQAFDPKQQKWIGRATTLAAVIPAAREAVRGDVQRLGQFLAAGESNQVFDPGAQPWMDHAVTLPKLIAAAFGDADEAEVARQVLAKLTPEAIAAAIPDDIAARVADQLAARLNN